MASLSNGGYAFTHAPWGKELPDIQQCSGSPSRRLSYLGLFHPVTYPSILLLVMQARAVLQLLFALIIRIDFRSTNRTH